MRIMLRLRRGQSRFLCFADQDMSDIHYSYIFQTSGIYSVPDIIFASKTKSQLANIIWIGRTACFHSIKFSPPKAQLAYLTAGVNHGFVKISTAQQFLTWLILRFFSSQRRIYTYSIKAPTTRCIFYVPIS